MTRKKETYLTINQNPKTKRIFYKSVDGNVEVITDTNGNKFRIGYHYDHKCREWIATELSTGRRLNPHLESKQKVIDFVHEKKDSISSAMQILLRKNKSQVKDFRNHAEAECVQIYPT